MKYCLTECFSKIKTKTIRWISRVNKLKLQFFFNKLFRRIYMKRAIYYLIITLFFMTYCSSDDGDKSTPQQKKDRISIISGDPNSRVNLSEQQK